MIYLRTSNDKIIKWRESCIPAVKISKTGQITMKYRDMTIISSGPTIASVSDTFVYIIDGEYHIMDVELTKADSIQKGYAAIWTKQGLKFIAKLNKTKGEFELLREGVNLTKKEHIKKENK